MNELPRYGSAIYQTRLSMAGDNWNEDSALIAAQKELSVKFGWAPGSYDIDLLPLGPDYKWGLGRFEFHAFVRYPKAQQFPLQKGFNAKLDLNKRLQSEKNEEDEKTANPLYPLIAEYVLHHYQIHGDVLIKEAEYLNAESLLIQYTQPTEPLVADVVSGWPETSPVRQLQIRFDLHDLLKLTWFKRWLYKEIMANWTFDSIPPAVRLTYLDFVEHTIELVIQLIDPEERKGREDSFDIGVHGYNELVAELKG